MTVDRHHLEEFLAERLHVLTLDLRPLDVACACPVFRGTAFGLDPIFVKVVDAATAERAWAFLLSAAACDLVPHPAAPGPFPFGDGAVLCLTWKESARVEAEKMTDAQLEGFLSGCLRLAALLRDYRGDVLPLSDEDAPDAQFAALEAYAARHPLVRRLLRPLLALPYQERSYGDRDLVVIHGDLQPKNYGFDGDRLSAVYDTDDLTLGLACEDATYAFTERLRRSDLTETARTRLCALFGRLVAASPWPAEEWRIAVNHARLRIAARRLKNHPDSAFIAFDIARRDKPLRRLLDVLSAADADRPPALKIFCVYFDRRPVWKSDCVEPIQAGRARSGEDLGMLADDTGDQISAENARYGEMTAWYWVWKNYLPAHPELAYVGFSHYRRFLDFTGFCRRGRTRRTTYRAFARIFERRYREREILSAVGGADLVMRGATDCGYATLREQYLHSHPKNIADFDRFVTLLRERHPNRLAEIDATLRGGRLAMELQFVMKRAVFEDFMDWTFSLCRAFEARWTWEGPSEGDQARAPAFLVERLFLVWLAIRRAERGLTVKELPLVKLTGRPWWYFLLKPVLPFLSEAANDRLYAKYK